jgi:hypothetical protein
MDEFVLSLLLLRMILFEVADDHSLTFEINTWKVRQQVVDNN